MAADPIDERYDQIVRELRALPGAPAELRERVRALGSAADERRPRRRRGLTLAVAAGLLVVAAVAGIVLGSGSNPKSATPRERSAGASAARAAPGTATRAEFAPFTPKLHGVQAKPSLTGGGGSIGLPVNPARLNDVNASMLLLESKRDGLDGMAYKTVRKKGG